MFYLIFKYRTTVSPCIDIVTGIFFILQQRRPHEQSLVAVQKWVSICIRRHGRQLWQILSRDCLSNYFSNDQELHRSGNLGFSTAQAWDILDFSHPDVIDDIQIKWPVF